MFRFKQFSVDDRRSAMKVTTDSTVLGAWVDVSASPRRILDIGAGCGLLALMLAQRVPWAMVHAVEIEEGAAEDARTNFAASPWGARLHLHVGDVLTMPLPAVYDLIVSNPPFYSETLQSPHGGRALARHGEGLNVSTLVACAARLLTAQGSLAMVVPANREGDALTALDAAGMHLWRRMATRHRAGGALTRIYLQAGRVCRGAPAEEVLTLYDESGRRSSQYSSLTEAFYL